MLARSRRFGWIFAAREIDCPGNQLHFVLTYDCADARAHYRAETVAMIGSKIVTFFTLNQSEHSLHATYSKTDRDRPRIFKCVMILRDDLYSGQNGFFPEF